MCGLAAVYVWHIFIYLLCFFSQPGWMLLFLKRRHFLQFFCSTVHSSQGNAAGGNRAHVTLLLVRRRLKTNRHTRLGLQLSRLEDSCEAIADMVGGTALNESICPVKIDSNFCICFLDHSKSSPVLGGLK